MKLFNIRKNLDQRGFDHVLLAVACVVVFGVIGTALIVASHAATTPTIQWKGALEKGSATSGYCLTSTGSSTSSKVVLNPCTSNNSNQTWSLVNTKTATIMGVSGVQEFFLQNGAGSNECLNNPYGSKKSGTAMQLYPCKSTDNASTWVWGSKFTSLKLSSHQLINVASISGSSGKCLDDAFNSNSANNKVQSFGCKTGGATNQNWFEASAPSSTTGGGGTGGSNSTTTATCTSPKPTAPVTGYTIAACDDFNSGFGGFGPYSGGGSGTVVGAGRIPSQCTITGGMLELKQASSGATCGGSLLGYSQRYGYWEVKMRAYSTGSSGSAPHPVLILWPDSTNSSSKTSEIDYFETDLGTAAHGFLHCAGGGSTKNVNCFVIPNSSIDYSQWHVYGLQWTPTSMTGYIDGQKWWSVTGSVFNSVNPLVSSHQTIQLDNLSGSTPVKTGEMDVDWAHMYK